MGRKTTEGLDGAFRETKISPVNRARIWMNDCKPTADKGDYVAVVGRAVLGPCQTEEEAKEKSRARDGTKEPIIFRLSELVKITDPIPTIIPHAPKPKKAAPAKKPASTKKSRRLVITDDMLPIKKRKYNTR